MLETLIALYLKQKNKIIFACGYYKDGFEKNKIWR